MDCTSCHDRVRSEVKPPLPAGGDPRIGKPEDAGEGNKAAQAGRQASLSSGMSQMMAATMAGRSASTVMDTRRREFIRARFDCLVDEVRANVGQVIKKGDPLVGLFSTDLFAAKIDYKTAQRELESKQDRLRWSQEMLAKGYVTQGQSTADRNAEENARLRVQLARDKLHVLGLDDEAIGRIGKEGDKARARLMLRSPVTGTVVQRAAVLGNRYNTNDILMVIAATPPEKPAVP
jgi:multidrug resistance efflux pump